MTILVLALLVIIVIPLIGAMIARQVQRRTRTPELDRMLFRKVDQPEEED